MLPQRPQNFVPAAKRELHEETGIDVSLDDVRHLSTVEKADSKVSYRAPLILVRVKHDDLPVSPTNPWEIADVQWFKLDNLPTPLSSLTKLALNKHKADL